ncbi:MAG: TIGR04076 family protein [Candidatus Lokiarchaeota archaeon]|nr:TIGR04076 family protein [Candidatus Lokiarchaeota archaeon]MBD3340733.1 TIGR04076 family protein [Candidatus Lokiarchaeota archaeon]
MTKLTKCKITILKKTLNRNLIEEYISNEYKDLGQCERFEEGQEFIIDPTTPKVPEGFCDWAWADIRKDLITIASGGNMFWLKNPNMTIVGCTDWFRPVYFKIEKIE